jgi:hypothetical protein
MSAEQAPPHPQAPAPPPRDPRPPFQQLLDNLGATPFVAGLLAAVGYLLLGTRQGADLVHTVVEEGPNTPRFWLQTATLVATSAFLGVEAWFWSRRMVVDACGYERENWRPRWLLEGGPRALGAAPFLLAGAAILRSGEKIGVLAAALFLLGAGFIALLNLRAVIEARVAPRLSARPSGRGGFARGFVRVNWALAALMMIWISLDPVRPARFLGAISVVFLGVGLIIAVMAAVIHRGRRWRLPVVLILLALALAFSAAGQWWWGDNHAVGRRAFGGGSDQGPAIAARPTFPQAFDAWWRSAPAGPDGRKPLIVVAAAGGASRAGYWAADVLGELQDRSQGRFAPSVFAISSVSGGSVGALAFASQLYDDPQAGGRFGDAVRATAGGDFLSPALAGLLFPDLAQHFLPMIPLGHGAVLALPDRAEALEKAFEQSWTGHCRRFACRDPRLWREPLQTLWSDPARPVPLVFVNGAQAENGRRVLTSRVAIDSAEFPDALDFYAATGQRDLAISSAIHNGARFPFVSPGGTLLDQQGRAHGHVLDGGYFENSGLTTAADIVHAAMLLAKDPANPRPIRPIVVELNNDSDEDPRAPVFDRHWPVRRPPDLVTWQDDVFLSDVLGPLGGLTSSRDGRATPVAIELSRELGDDYQLVRLSNVCAEGEPVARRAPMDWVLSRAAKDIIRKAATCEAANQAALAHVLAALPPR